MRQSSRIRVSSAFTAITACTLLVVALAGEQPPAGSPQALCVQLTPAALGAITSASYTGTTSQIDTAAMKHCEYRGGAHTVSVMFVRGSGARERYDTSTKFPGTKPVTGIGDQANWEPVRGTFSMLAGDRAVEVRISASHGTPTVRLQHARQIAQLVVDKVS